VCFLAAEMDLLNILSEIPAEGTDAVLTSVLGNNPISQNADDHLLQPDDNFFNLLTDDEVSDNFGLSLLENNHDLIEIMAPLIDPMPYSPFRCDEFDVMENIYPDDSSIRIYADETQLPEPSPLRQLLLSKTSVRETDEHGTTDTPAQKKQKRSRSRNQTREKKAQRKSTSSSSDNSIKSETSEYNAPKEKFVSKALKFPPCEVCGGNASGLHYGVNSCEACKGFFRRYIIRNEEYRCAKGGNCKVVNKNRENCSGCRLKRCLDLGMSQKNSKLGRYSLSRRTETIKQVKVLEGKEKTSTQQPSSKLNSFKFDHTYSDHANSKSPLGFEDIVSVENSPDVIIEQLVAAMDSIQPYGPTIITKHDIQKRIKYHHQRYVTKLEMYGQMKAIPRDEYYKLLKEYGIDVDGRIKVFKEYITKIKRISEKYYNFASQIPGFNKLGTQDQSSLLKASRCDFFITLMHEGYSAEYDILLARNGVAYHIEELADKCFSRPLLRIIVTAYHRLQSLELTKEEKALLVALTLVFTDRCQLENRDQVDKMQHLMSELIRYQLERTSGPMAYRRFAKFTDCLVFLRDVADKYWQEYKQLCKDDVLVEHVPMIKEFMADEW